MSESPDPGAPDRSGPYGRPDAGPPDAPLSWYRARQPDLPAFRGRRRWLRRDRVLDALACLALSALCFSQATTEILFRADRDFYNLTPLAAPTLVALILNVVVLAAAGLLALQAIRRIRRSVVRHLAAVAAAAALLVALNFTRITYETLGSLSEVLGRPGVLALAALILVAAVGWPQRALRVIRGVALVLSPLAVLTLAQASWMFLEMAAGPIYRRVEPTPSKAIAPSLRRVVWLVFEELDQTLTFEARPSGLELPELDRLRRESLYADAARPPAGTTELSMTALITGRTVVDVTPLTPHDLELTFADGKTMRWSAHPNVFSRARVFGYDTALVGWHLPYPRVLGGSLGAAAFRPSANYEQARGDTIGEALRNQWASLAPPVHVRRLASQRVAELGDMALRAATDGRFSLVLLHLPLPRLPGIYDRAAGRLTAWNFAGPEAEYLDNLALVDRFIGELRRSLDRARLGDRTWVVLTSNRRTRAAKPADGHADHRVPLLVHPPEGGRNTHVDAPFNTLGVHDLVLAILRGSIVDTDGAVTWISRYPSTPPNDYTSHGRPIY